MAEENERGDRPFVAAETIYIVATLLAAADCALSDQAGRVFLLGQLRPSTSTLSVQ
jgi:hypothetical protein